MGSEDGFRDHAEAYALGALDRPERDAFQEHLASGCRACAERAAAHRAVLPSLARATEAPPREPRRREELLELAEAPRLPLDPAAYAWEEPFPGFRAATLKEDPGRAFRASLIWARPGVRYPAHRHRGEEILLVLQGSCRDENGAYRAGEVARQRPGSVHRVDFFPGEDCIGYVLAWGGHDLVES